MTRRMVVLFPRLPLTTRARLHTEQRIDRAGAWLCSHRCTWLARWLWKACRMW